MYVCVYVCMFIGMYAFLSLCVSLSVFYCVYVSVYLSVCMSVYIYIYIYICIYIYIYICVCVCVRACVCVYIECENVILTSDYIQKQNWYKSDCSKQCCSNHFIFTISETHNTVFFIAAGDKSNKMSASPKKTLLKVIILGDSGLVNLKYDTI